MATTAPGSPGAAAGSASAAAASPRSGAAASGAAAPGIPPADDSSPPPAAAAPPPEPASPVPPAPDAPEAEARGPGSVGGGTPNSRLRQCEAGAEGAPRRDGELARLRRELAEARARTALAEQRLTGGEGFPAPRPLPAGPGEGWGLPPPAAEPGGALWAWPHERERLREHDEQRRRAWGLAARAPGAHHFGFDCCVAGARGAGVTSLCAAMRAGAPAPPGGGAAAATVRYAAAAAPVPVHLRIGLVELRAGDTDGWTAAGCAAGVFVFYDEESLDEALAAAERVAAEVPVRLLAYNAPAEEDDSGGDDDAAAAADGAAALRAAEARSGLAVVEVCALSCRGVGALLDALADAAWHRLLAWPPESALLADNVRIGPLCSEDPALAAEMAAALWEGPLRGGSPAA